jgi:DNA replication protein DnaC
VIRQKVVVKYFRTNELLREMKLAQHTGSSVKLKRQLVQPQLLILDDFGIVEIDEEAAEMLLDLLDARIDFASTMVIGQRAVEQWHDYIGSAHMADAIIDRLLQRAHRLNIKGPSLRKRLK